MAGDLAEADDSEISMTAGDVAGHIGVVNLGTRRDLTSNDDHPGLGQSLTRDPALRVVGEQRIQDPIRDLVTHLVRVPLGYRFRGEEKVFCRHKYRLLGQPLSPL